MVQIILFLIVGIILGALIYLATLKGDFEVSRSKVMSTNIDTVFDTVSDLKKWPEWSPWLIHEPECKLIYSENCDQEYGYYQWDGHKVGSGKLTHEKILKPVRIEQKIEFFRPFKSEGDVSFDFIAQHGQTEVTWTMQSTMPFLFRFMIPKMVAMIGKDYELGLAMLSGKLDPSAEHPRLRFDDEVSWPSQLVLTQHFSGKLEEMQLAMKKGFTELMDYLEQFNIPKHGNPFTAYHKVNLTKKYFTFDLAVPVPQSTTPGPYQLKQLGGGRYQRVILQGSYEFLELAWYAAMIHLKMSKIKPDMRRPSIEIYENNPDLVSRSNDLTTTILVPIK